MSKPTRCQSVTRMSEAIAQLPLDCQSGPVMPIEASSLLKNPLYWSNIQAPSTPVATPEITSGRKMIER